MKDYLVYFVSGCALGLAIPAFFGTLSRHGRPYADEEEISEKEEKPKEEIKKEAEDEDIDPRFVFPHKFVRNFGEQKLVIGVNMSVKSTATELASLISDATIKAVIETKQKNLDSVLSWYHCCQAKITVKIPNDEVMNKTIEVAKEKNVPFVTVNMGDKIAAIAVGPGPLDIVNQVTDGFKLI